MIARAAKEVVRPILFSMSIIVAAMLPIFTLERVEGRIFRPMALTYAFALGGALLFTLTAVPALATSMLKNRKVKEEEPEFLISFAQNICGRSAWALEYPITTRLAGFVVLAAAIALIPGSAPSFCPR